MALPWVPKRKSKGKRKGRITGGKQTFKTKSSWCCSEAKAQPRPEQRQMQPWEDEPTRGPEQGFGRVGWGFRQGGECERPRFWNGKPHTVTALGSRPGAGRELRELKPWLGCGWEGRELVVHSNQRPVGRLYGVWGER